jgi:hypothetical protein
LVTEVLGADGVWQDADSPATAAKVARERTGVVYRTTVRNCGVEVLNDVVVTTGIPSAPTWQVGELAPKESRVSPSLLAGPEQLSTVATAEGKGAVGGKLISAQNPAYAVPADPLAPIVLGKALPATGSSMVLPQLLLAFGLLGGGIIFALYARRLAAKRS